jgi:hypothetical protein
MTGGKSVKPSRAVMPFDDALLARWRRNGAEMVQKKNTRAAGVKLTRKRPKEAVGQGFGAGDQAASGLTVQAYNTSLNLVTTRCSGLSLQIALPARFVTLVTIG